MLFAFYSVINERLFLKPEVPHVPVFFKVDLPRHYSHEPVTAPTPLQSVVHSSEENNRHNLAHHHFIIIIPQR